MSVTADHFDPSKFDANGNRRPRVRGAPGNTSVIRPTEVSGLMALIRASRVDRRAKIDVSIFFASRGVTSRKCQLNLISRLRNGWRPKK